MILHRRTGRTLVAVILAKLALAAVVVLLPTGLAVSLGAAHAVVVAVVLVTGAAVALLYRRRRRTGPTTMADVQWEDWYASPPHWDIGRPQPAFAELAASGAIRGRVLDAGCGTGEHVLMCAELGLDATGVDIVPAALAAAERKARERGLTARFLRHDARDLAALGTSFDTVVDSGLFHTFDDHDRAAYVAGVRSVLVPGGRFHLLCFRDDQPGGEGPRRVSRDEIAATFALGWVIDSVTPVPLVSGHGDVKGWLVSVTRQETRTLSARAEVPTDRAGRYVDQFCRHAAQMHRAGWRHAPSGSGTGVGVERTADGAVVHIGAARCVLRATPDALVLVAEAPDEATLARVKDIVGSDVARFGRRAGLTVSWTG